MTSHTSIIGHGRRKRGGFRWEQHGAPLDAFSRLACQSELELEPLRFLGGASTRSQSAPVSSDSASFAFLLSFCILINSYTSGLIMVVSLHCLSFCSLAAAQTSASLCLRNTGMQ